MSILTKTQEFAQNVGLSKQEVGARNLYVGKKKERATAYAIVIDKYG